MISRRRFTAGVAIALTPLRARASAQEYKAQQALGRVYRIGILSPDSPPPGLFEAFQEGLRELGYVDGKNVAMESRNAGGKNERLAALTIETSRVAGDATGSAFSNLQVWIRGYLRANVLPLHERFFTVLTGIKA